MGNMTRKMFVGMAVTLSVAALLAACGGSSSPASPSSPASSASSGSGAPGATISGTVSGTATASAAGYQKLEAGNGVTVTVSGTNLSVTCDGQGKFTFTGVPSGTVQLVFTAGGASATLTLDGVKTTDKITIQVTLKGTTATLDNEQRNGTTVSELEDRITAKAADGTLVVGTTKVILPAGIPIRHGQTTIQFAQLNVGDRVHVRGTLAGTTMTATEVIVQNQNANVPMNASGTVSGRYVIGSGCTAKTIGFLVEGWTVETTSATDFQKTTCETLTNGVTVHV
jgi:hypothetical protein